MKKVTYLTVQPNEIYPLNVLTVMLGFNKSSDAVGKRLRGYGVPSHRERINGRQRKCYTGSDIIAFANRYPLVLQMRNPSIIIEKTKFIPIITPTFNNGDGIDGDAKYTVRQLADIVGVSRQTMHLRLNYYGIYMNPSVKPMTVRGEDFMNIACLHPSLTTSTQTQKPVETPNLSDKSEGFLSIMERVAKLKKIVKGLPIDKAKALIQSFSDGLKAKC